MSDSEGRRVTDSREFMRKELFTVIASVIISSFMTASASYIVMRERLAVVEREIIFLQRQIDRIEKAIDPVLNKRSM